MPDAQAEQETARVPGREPVVGRADGRGVVLPYVEDPGRDGDVVRRVENALDVAQVAVRGTARPDGPVTQRFHLGQ
jgi:hypothetical protein